ncbi:hypothetical protein ABPG72_015048 [Tetrahymena utriculariae]
MFKKSYKAIAIIFLIFCLTSAASPEVVTLHQEKIYEFKKANGPLVYELQANLVKNQSDYLMIEVESLTLRQDTQIYISLQGKIPLSQKDSDVVCSRYEYDVCLIPASQIKQYNLNSDDVKVIFTVSCQNDCSFELYASYENSLPLPINDEKILVAKEPNDLELQILIENTKTKPINTFILTAELLNPIEIEHYFSMSIMSEEDGKVIYEGNQLGYGPIKGVFEIRGDKICKETCSLHLLIDARKGSLIKINTYGYDKVREIDPFKIYYDQVEANSELVMKLDLNYFKEIEHINLNQKTINFQLVPKSGTCSLSVHPSQIQPQDQSSYMFKSEEENTQAIRIHYDQHKREDHVYWININTKKSRCVFSLKSDFVDNLNQQITINHPITGKASKEIPEEYKLTLLGNHSQAVKVILHGDNPYAELYIKLCSSQDECIVSQQDIQKKKGFFQISNPSSSQSKIVKFNHVPQNCPDYKDYKEVHDNFPACTYLIVIYSAQKDFEYTIEAISSSKYIQHVTLRENESIFDSVAESEDNLYRFQVFDNIDELKFVAKTLFGKITVSAFFSADGANVNLDNNQYPIQVSQWNEMSFKYPKIGFYYISVIGNTDSQYTITPVVERPEKRGEIHILKLKQDIPQQIMEQSGSKLSYFEISITNFEDQYPEIWFKIDQNTNEYQVFMTKDRDMFISGKYELFEWQFTKHFRTDLHLDSDTISTIQKKKLYLIVVPVHKDISQFYVIKYHFSFAYSILEYSKPAKGHISSQSSVLYKIPIFQPKNLQITKTVVNSRQNNIKIQIDFNEVFSGQASYFDEQSNDILSIPAETIEKGCQIQNSSFCFLYINLLSSKECDYQIQVDEQVEGTPIMAYDGYSNLLLVPDRISKPIQVCYVINKPETVVITTQNAKGLIICATIINSLSQFEMVDYPQQNACQYKSDDKQFYDHNYIKISKKDVEEFCKFSDPRNVCGLDISIFTRQDSDIQDKFRLSINSGIVELQKGKPVVGHAGQQGTEYFKYISNSEDPIKVHVLPLDSSDVDVFVVFGEENRPLPFKDYGWSLQPENYDDNILEINQPLKIQNGSLQGVYVIAVYSKFSYSRFQITVTQEILHVQELFQNSIYNYKISENSGLYFEYTPHPAETEFTIKVIPQYGKPKIAVNKMKLGLIEHKSLPDIVNGNYAFTNKYDAESEQLSVKILDCNECMYYIQIYSFNQNSKFTLQISATESQLMLYNQIYSYKFESQRKTQKLQYHSQEQGFLVINMEYGEAEAIFSQNGQDIFYKLLYFIEIPYAFGQDLQVSITCSECSFSVQTVKFYDLMTYKFGQLKYLALEHNQEFKMQFFFNPKQPEELLKLNLLVENLVSDEHTLLLYKPEVVIHYIEKRYDNFQVVAYQMHKFHESYSLSFKAKQGQYQIRLRWPVNPKYKDLQDKLFLKVFMTQNDSIFLQPSAHYSAHILGDSKIEIVQKKTISSELKEHETGLEVVFHICYGKLNSLGLVHYMNNKQETTRSILLTENPKNVYIYDSFEQEKEIFFELKTGKQETYFNVHSQKLQKGQISLYRKIQIPQDQIIFEVQDDKVNLFFEGVSIRSEYQIENVKPKIKYEVYLFKKVQDVQNQLCPQIDLLELDDGVEEKTSEAKKESGLYITSYISEQFNQNQTMSFDKKKILEDRDLANFYFTVQANVEYNNQEAKLMYNIERVYSVDAPIYSEQNDTFNYILYLIIAGSAVTIVILVILVRRKMKYGLLPETNEVQLEQVVQQEVSHMKAPNHVISPNQSIHIDKNLEVLDQENMKPSSIASINPSSKVSINNTQRGSNKQIINS